MAKEKLKERGRAKEKLKERGRSKENLKERRKEGERKKVKGRGKPRLGDQGNKERWKKQLKVVAQLIVKMKRFQRKALEV